MRPDDMIMVSVDDHLVEPPTMFDAHIPAKHRDAAPKVVRKDDGSDVWMFNGAEIPNVGLNAVAGRPKEEYGIEPTAFDEMRPGCWDIAERVKDMDAGGILGSMCFPSFPGFSGRLFAAADDKDLALAVVQAYNDWHVDEWCGAAPGRFIPMGLPVLWDPELAAAEVRRLAKKGVHSVTFTENPATLGYPSFHSDHWDPLWRALRRRGRRAVDPPRLVGPARLHGRRRADGRAHHPAADEHLLGGRRPAVVAGDQGAPHAQDRAQRGRHRLDPLLPRPARPHLRHAPPVDGSGLRWAAARRRSSATTSSPASSPTPWASALRDLIGIDNIAWECDYPHSDSSWPEAPEELAAVAVDVPDDELDKITYQNALRWYSYDPFAHVPKAEATVGALRAKAAGHDVSIRSFDKGRFERTGKGVDLGTMTARATA